MAFDVLAEACLVVLELAVTADDLLRLKDGFLADSSARRNTLHLPENSSWETGWTNLFDHAFVTPSVTPT